MTDTEFYKRIGEAPKPNEREFKVTQYVYNHHPSIKTKDEIAEIYCKYGMRVIYDMLPTARKFAEICEKRIKLRLEIDTLNDMEKELLNGGETDDTKL